MEKECPVKREFSVFGGFQFPRNERSAPDKPGRIIGADCPEHAKTSEVRAFKSLTGLPR